MSVIIKGMDMPKSCYECAIYCKELNIVSGSDFFTKRLENCPLVALPKKHGRLIDADRLIARIENEMRSGLYADTEKDEETKRFVYAIHKLLIEQIQAEETVIESEGNNE